MNFVTYYRRKYTERGFTLIELLVVMAIIGMLASVILASLNTARDKAKMARAKADLSQIRVAMQLMLESTGKYPNGASAGSLCLTGNEETLDSTNALWNYMHYVKDPWGNDYYIDPDYRCGPTIEGCDGVDDSSSGLYSGVIVSFGPDGVEKYDEGDDIAFVVCRN